MFYELIKVDDQTVKLIGLDEILNDVARIQVAKSVRILHDSLLILFLFEKFVTVLLNNLTDYLLGDSCLLGVGLCLLVESFLDEHIDFFVNWHLIDAYKLSLQLKPWVALGFISL